MAPPGFRFTPTDSELVTHYLLKRAKSLPVPFPITYVPKFIRINPVELPGIIISHLYVLNLFTQTRSISRKFVLLLDHRFEFYLRR